MFDEHPKVRLKDGVGRRLKLPHTGYDTNGFQQWHLNYLGKRDGWVKVWAEGLGVFELPDGDVFLPGEKKRAAKPRADTKTIDWVNGTSDAD
jgi:hypothetical protein